MSDKIRVDFEQWYTCNAFDYCANPVGSRDCGLQRAAYYACAESMQADKDRLEARVKELEDGLLEAAEEIYDWGQYAMDYFQEKHDLKGCVQKYTDLAKEVKQNENNT